MKTHVMDKYIPFSHVTGDVPKQWLFITSKECYVLQPYQQQLERKRERCLFLRQSLEARIISSLTKLIVNRGNVKVKNYKRITRGNTMTITIVFNICLTILIPVFIYMCPFSIRTENWVGFYSIYLTVS